MKTMRIPLDIVYAEGYNAFREGTPITNCPYHSVEISWDLVRHWEWGWECAQKMSSLGIKL